MPNLTTVHVPIKYQMTTKAPTPLESARSHCRDDFQKNVVTTVSIIPIVEKTMVAQSGFEQSKQFAMSNSNSTGCCIPT